MSVDDLISIGSLLHESILRISSRP
jgi:hypothetical protein